MRNNHNMTTLFHPQLSCKLARSAVARRMATTPSRATAPVSTHAPMATPPPPPAPLVCTPHTECRGNTSGHRGCNPSHPSNSHVAGASAGTVYNAASNQCDFPSNVPACSTSSSPVKHAASPVAPAIPSPSPAAPKTQSPSAAIASPSPAVAKLPSPVTPASPSPAVATVPSPAASTSNFCSGKADGNYANPANCAQFFQCANGVTYSATCAAGPNPQ